MKNISKRDIHSRPTYMNYVCAIRPRNRRLKESTTQLMSWHKYEKSRTKETYERDLFKRSIYMKESSTRLMTWHKYAKSRTQENL